MTCASCDYLLTLVVFAALCGLLRFAYNAGREVGRHEAEIERLKDGAA